MIEGKEEGGIPIPLDGQPVLLKNSAKTKRAGLCAGAAEGTAIKITKKERREV